MGYLFYYVRVRFLFFNVEESVVIFRRVEEWVEVVEVEIVSVGYILRYLGVKKREKNNLLG